MNFSLTFSHKFAIKQLKQKFDDFENDVRKYREFQAIMALSEECDYLCHIYEVIRESDCSLYYVCEYMPDGTLNDFISTVKTRGERIGENQILSILRQVLKGLQHIHSKGYMHRDMKPENLLMCGTKCKVADFSLSRGTTQVANCGKKMTTYVSTRWYRAPELLLSAPTYSTAIDMFALGCIMAELYELKPLLPGIGEVQQLELILKFLGPLNHQTWSEGVELASRKGFQIPSPTKKDVGVHGKLSSLFFPNASHTAICLLERLLKLNSKDRPSASEALDHAYFKTRSSTVTTNQHQEDVVYPATPLNTTGASVCDFEVPFVSVSPRDRHSSILRNGNDQEQHHRHWGHHYPPLQQYEESAKLTRFISSHDHPRNQPQAVYSEQDNSSPQFASSCYFPEPSSRRRRRDCGYTPSHAFCFD